MGYTHPAECADPASTDERRWRPSINNREDYLHFRPGGDPMRIRTAAAAALLLVAGLLAPASPAAAATSTPPQVYGAWHCGNDACTWSSVRDMTDFDTNNHCAA
jgi:hypothetical protein